VPRASDPDTYFLLADTLQDDHLSQEPAPTLLHDFARLAARHPGPDADQDAAAGVVKK